LNKGLMFFNNTEFSIMGELKKHIEWSFWRVSEGLKIRRNLSILL
jgi:hypothetical protein